MTLPEEGCKPRNGGRQAHLHFRSLAPALPKFLRAAGARGSPSTPLLQDGASGIVMASDDRLDALMRSGRVRRR